MMLKHLPSCDHNEWILTIQHQLDDCMTKNVYCEVATVILFHQKMEQLLECCQTLKVFASNYQHACYDASMRSQVPSHYHCFHYNIMRSIIIKC